MSTESTNKEGQSTLSAEDQHSFLSWQKSHRRAKFAAGIMIILFGTAFLLKEIGFHIPGWVFTPGPILIAISLVVLAKHKFRAVFGYILLVVGKIFLLHEFYPEAIRMNYIWPVLIILFGAGLLFGSKRKFNFRKHHMRHHPHHHHHHQWEKHQRYMEAANDLGDVSQDDFIDAVSIFGGLHKNVVSKQFRGADIVTIFGGNEINLSQADFNQQVVMDVTNIFGGTTLTIPNNWQVKSEVVTIMGNIEDKRVSSPANEETPARVVLLRGTCIFGGIEINSFN